MARKRYTMKLDFTKGSDLQSTFQAIPPGFMWVSENYDPRPEGNLRPRRRWEFDESSVTTTGPQGGISVYFSFEGGTTGGLFVAGAINPPATTMDIWRAPSETSNVWTLIDSVTTPASTVVPVNFVTGNGIVLYGSPTFPSQKLRFWNGTTAADASALALGGNTLAYYAERFWSLGVFPDLHKAYYSGIQDHTSWDLTNQNVLIGPKDGSNIWDAIPAMGGLVIAKDSGVFFLTGAGPSTFTVDKLDNGDGRRGRCLVATPYGVVIVGSNDVWLWEGGRGCRRISDRIGRNPIQDGTVSTAYIGGEVYISRTNSGFGYIVDMETGRWRQETHARTVPGADTVDSIKVIAAAGEDLNTMIGLPSPASTSVHKQGVWRRTYSAPFDLDRDDTTPVTHFSTRYRASTGDFALGGAEGPFTLNHVYLLLRQRGTGNPNGQPLDVTVNARVPSNSISKSFIPDSESDGTLIRERIDCGLTGYYVNLLFEQHIKNPTGSNNAVYEILEVTLEYEMEQPR